MGLVEGTSAKKRDGYQIITIEPTKKPEEIRLRVAAYARVSSDSNDQENSLAAQTRYYIDHITEMPQWDLVDIYADDGISGTSAEKRTDFQRLMNDCRRVHLPIRSKHPRVSTSSSGAERDGYQRLLREGKHRY